MRTSFLRVSAWVVAPLCFARSIEAQEPPLPLEHARVARKVTATPDTFQLLENACESIRILNRDTPARKVVDENALVLARQALAEPFDSLRQISQEQYIRLLDEAPRIAEEFVRDSQIKASRSDWTGAMDARLNALELGVKMESAARSTNNAGFFAYKIEAVAMKEIYPLAAHFDGDSAEIIAARLDAIEAGRPLWIDLLETNRAENLRSVKEYLQKPDWKERIVSDSRVEHFVGIDPHGPTYSGVTIKQLEGISAPVLMKQVERFWDFCLEKESRAVAKPTALGFELNEATAFLLNAFDSDDRSAFFTAHANALLLCCTLKLKAIREKTGAYPFHFNTPNDPYGDGKPLIYWTVGKSYRLYSVGPDGRDDGAQTPLSRLQARWPDDLIPPLLEPESEPVAK